MITIKDGLQTITCDKCGQEKFLSAFGGHHKSKDGLQSACQECREFNRQSAPKQGGVLRK